MTWVWRSRLCIRLLLRVCICDGDVRYWDDRRADARSVDVDDLVAGQVGDQSGPRGGADADQFFGVAGGGERE